MWPIVGNQRVISHLEIDLKSGHLSHAYLFTGRSQIGKTTTALTLASAVNCSAGEKPCGECSSCIRIASGKHPDVEIIGLLSAEESEDKKAKNEVVIEQVRKLQHSASLPPYEGRCRVFIFEHAELMNDETANRLLKTLEEPLPNVMFILIAHDRGELPETIISRCRVMEFRPVPKNIIERLLITHGVRNELADKLARMACGAPGWAVKAIEKEEMVQRHSEMMGLLIDLISADYEERFEAAGELNQRIQNRNELTGLIEDWLGLWRDMVLIKAGQADEITNLGFKKTIISLVSRLILTDIKNFTDDLCKTKKKLHYNVNTRLAIEAVLLKMPKLHKAVVKG